MTMAEDKNTNKLIQSLQYYQLIMKDLSQIERNINLILPIVILIIVMITIVVYHIFFQYLFNGIHLLFSSLLFVLTQFYKPQSTNLSMHRQLNSMQPYLFGTMNEYLEASYAPTARAACKSCKLKIPKDALRMGVLMESDHFVGKNWYHIDCFTLRPLFKDIDPEKQIYKINTLKPQDSQLVINLIKLEAQKFKQPAKKGKNKQKSKSSQKELKKESKVQIVAKQQSKQKQIKSKSKKKRNISASKTKKKKKTIATGGYTEAQQAQFKELLQKFMKNSTAELKIILAANNQSKTGTKGELAQKCADGKLLGKIPMCSNCGGGKLRFNRKTGIYNCPGYMDDDEFKNCNKIYLMSQIQREAWKNG